MARTPTIEVLGEVTLPSGSVVILDTGLLGMWCHDRDPILPEGRYNAETTRSANSSIDFEIAGPDAERAGRAFDRQYHTRYLYDIPAHGIEQVQASFQQTLEEHGLDARLVPLPRRVSHRQRISNLLTSATPAASSSTTASRPVARAICPPTGRCECAGSGCPRPVTPTAGTRSGWSVSRAARWRVRMPSGTSAWTRHASCLPMPTPWGPGSTTSPLTAWRTS
jgi:hypothetical protein